MDTILNRDHLADNHCFGCGLHNPHGLHTEIRRDPNDPNRLRADFTPSEEMSGFPSITHGGAIYTAMDCLSTWVASTLGPNPGAAWLLRAGSTKYSSPAPTGQPMTLYGWIVESEGEWEPLTVAIEARRPDGTLCAEAEFKVVPLSPDRFKQVAGIDEIPENWMRFLKGEFASD